VLACLLVEQCLGLEDVPSGSPGMRCSTGLLDVSEVLGGNSAVPHGTLELGCCLLEHLRSSLELFLSHEPGNSSGHEIGTSSGKRAYASLGTVVSVSTPAPCASAVAFAG
jgi:hypothetical protein